MMQTVKIAEQLNDLTSRVQFMRADIATLEESDILAVREQGTKLLQAAERSSNKTALVNNVAEFAAAINGLIADIDKACKEISRNINQAEVRKNAAIAYVKAQKG
ncbi:MAG: hypothetical protein ACPGXY_02350 [Alphaproteobacteria bacterium]